MPRSPAPLSSHPSMLDWVEVLPSAPRPPRAPEAALARLLREGATWGDATDWLPALPEASVDLFFMSPPYPTLAHTAAFTLTATSSGFFLMRGRCSGPRSRVAPSS
jgi:hypothetical protein